MNPTLDTPPTGTKVAAATDPLAAVKAALKPLASLQLTVVLFALAIVLVFFGTLAQINNGLWKVVDDYFWSYVVHIKLDLVAQFAKVFTPGLKVGTLEWSFPFPGGKTIGALMLLNLLAAHFVRFKLSWKRSGIILIHSGVALMLLGEWVTRERAVEQRMNIEEGTGTNYTFSTRLAELAIVDVTDPDDQTAAVLPFSLMKSGEVIRDDRLPVAVEVVAAYPNADLDDRAPSADSPADKGNGLRWKIQPKDTASGLEDNVDYPAAYVRLYPKGADKPVGTYLVSVILANVGRTETVEIGGRKYDLSLRLKRYYKPYTVFLTKFRFDRYLGTNTPKNYSSDVVLVDPAGGAERSAHISMNDPLRYDGEAYYQADFDKQTEKTTGLQVVRNPGWLIPYISCIVVGLGMLVHFSITLPKKAAAVTAGFDRAETLKAAAGVKRSTLDRYAPWVSLGVVGVVLLGAVAPLFVKAKPYDLDTLTRLPVVDGGRLKPLDTVARTHLRLLAGEERVKDEEGVKIPAIKWYLEAVSRGDAARRGPAFRYQTIRIDNEQVLNELKFKNRDGFRYSFEEIEPSLEVIFHRASAAMTKKKQKKPIDLTEQKFLDLAEKIQLYSPLLAMQVPLAVPPDAARAEWQSHYDVLKQYLPEARAAVWKQLKSPPLDVSTWPEDKQDTFFRLLRAEQQRIAEEKEPDVKNWNELLDAYRQQKPDEFNAALANYRDRAVAALTPAEQFKIGLEVAYNRVAPFYWATGLYVIGLVLSLAAVLGAPWARTSAYRVLAVTFVLHTLALITRMYLQGRPPVTNLYSSAVFIGWGSVGLGLILERVFRGGYALYAGSVLGFLTTLVAHGLDKGDSLEMMQAVLDTNFWLATHVVCITFGYVATAFCGILGVTYVVNAVFLPTFDRDRERGLSTLIYVVLCIAILLSFVGTVLGGIWADQSWGRFWGWDPKENGAVLIVLWNALVLHARWAGLVKSRGVAVLAIFGNVVTMWSWFGTNQLQVGLHSYGFSSELATWCTIVWGVHLAFVVVGLVPRQMWASTKPAAA